MTKRWIAVLCCTLFVSGIMFAGYRLLERALIQKELQADILAETDYVSQLHASHLSSRAQQALADVSAQNIAQLKQAAHTSKTLRQYHQQKQRLLDQWAQENKLADILVQEPSALH